MDEYVSRNVGVFCSAFVCTCPVQVCVEIKELPCLKISSYEWSAREHSHFMNDIMNDYCE